MELLGRYRDEQKESLLLEMRDGWGGSFRLVLFFVLGNFCSREESWCKKKWTS